MKKSNAFQRGFTLIELMIVIVILGILMGTILPRLTGAQSRARDTARRADLTNISQALEVYFADFGSYPPVPADGGGAHGCLGATDTASTAQGGTTTAVLGGYMKGGEVPSAVSSSQNTLGCTGSYFYMPITAGGLANGGYILATDMETYQLANYVATTIGIGEFNANSTAASYPTVEVTKANDDNNQLSTIFILAQ